MSEFVKLAGIASAYKNNLNTETISRSCERRLNDFMNKCDKNIRVIVLSDVACGCKNHRAYIDEHYDLGTLNPNRIYVKRDLAEKYAPLTFAGLCKLFLAENMFGALETFEGAEPELEDPYDTLDVGSYEADLKQFEEVINLVKTKYGEVIPFFQNLLIQELSSFVLRADQKDSERVREILLQLDDDIICNSRCVPQDILLKMFAFKYGEDIEPKLIYRSGRLKYNNLLVVPLKEIPFHIESIQTSKGLLKLQGSVMFPLENSPIEYYFMDNKNKRYDVSFEEGDNVSFLGEKMTTRKHFSIEMKLGKNPIGIRFMYRYRDLFHARVRMTFDKSIGIKDESKYNSCAVGQYLVKVEKRILFVAPLMKKTKIKLFFTFLQKSIKMYLLCM